MKSGDEVTYSHMDERKRGQYPCVCESDLTPPTSLAHFVLLHGYPFIAALLRGLDSHLPICVSSALSQGQLIANIQQFSFLKS